MFRSASSNLQSPSSRLWARLAIATNWPILAAVALLSAIGLLTIWTDHKPDGTSGGPKHLAYIIVGIGCMAAFQAINYQRIGRYAFGFYVFAITLVLYTAVGSRVHLPCVPELNHAHKWIIIGPMSLEPAELLKVAFVMLLARYLRFRSNYRTLSGLAAPFALALGPVLLILKQPDLGTAMIFLPTLFAMLYVAGAKASHLAAIVAVAILLCPVAWFAGKDESGVPHSRIRILQMLPQLVPSYQRDRITSMLHDDPQTRQKGGFQQQLALTAFGSGGIIGKGPGRVPVGRHVPESDNDMVFALIGEQFGFFGATVVLIAYLALFTAGVEIAGSTREPFGRLLALGVVAMIAAQTFSNLLVSLRLMPVTGVPLPFISTGGSSIVASFMSAGLLLNIGQNRPIVMAKDAFEFE